MKSIYTISNPKDGSVFYVGATSNLERRSKEHVSNAYLTRCTETLEEIASNGLMPIFTELEKAGEDWRDVEKRWIYHFIEKGEKLMNKEMKWLQSKNKMSNCIIKLLPNENPI